MWLSLSSRYLLVFLATKLTVCSAFNITNNKSDSEIFKTSSDYYDCNSRSISIDPHVLIQEDSSDIEWLLDKSISTHFQSEICLHDGQLCGNNIHSKNGSTFKTICSQRFFDIELLAISRKNNLTVTKSYKIPASCECTLYKKTRIKTQKKKN